VKLHDALRETPTARDARQLGAMVTQLVLFGAKFALPPLSIESEDSWQELLSWAGPKVKRSVTLRGDVAADVVELLVAGVRVQVQGPTRAPTDIDWARWRQQREAEDA
jgi:hypothetical protein